LSTRTAYRCGAACVAVETEDAGASRWLAEFVTPWFEPCSAAASACTVRFTPSRSLYESAERRRATASTLLFPCFGLDRADVSLPGWTDGGATIVADDELGSFYRVQAAAVEVIARPDDPSARIGLMRVVRELLVAGRLAIDPLLDLHAAAFETPVGAILLAGPKAAGKTTLLAHFLRGGGVALIGNDRVLVDVQAAPPVVLGVPVLVSIRERTLALFPELRRTPGERPAVWHSGERALSSISERPRAHPPRSFGLTPAQLALRCTSATARSAPVAAIVFPEIDPACKQWAVEPLAADIGSRYLLDSRYGEGATPRSQTIFERMMSRGGSRSDDTAVRAARLSTAVRLIRCRLGSRAYANGPRDLLQALTGAGAPAEQLR